MTPDEERLAELLHAVVPIVQGVTPGDVRRRVRRRQVLRGSAAMSGVAVAVAGVVLLFGALRGSPALEGPADAPTPVLSTSSSGVDLVGAVPWLDGPAAHLPRPTPSATGPAVDARACTAGDVTADAVDGGAGFGHEFLDVRFRNVSGSTCALLGYPRRMVATRSGRPDVMATNGSFAPDGVQGAMRPGGLTYLVVETEGQCPGHIATGSAADRYRALRVTLPGGGTSAVTVAAGLDVTCGLRSTRFSVQLQPPPEPDDPLAVLHVSLDAPASVAAGGDLVYVVDLANPTNKPLSLAPCPDYIQAAGYLHVKESHPLNCAPVGQIPARGSIRFVMHLPVPSQTPPGTAELEWSLSIAGGQNATGAVKITTPSRG